MFIKFNDCIPDSDLEVTDDDVIKAFKSLGYQQLIFKNQVINPLNLNWKENKNMTKEFIAFKTISDVEGMSFQEFASYANPNYVGKEETTLRRISEINRMYECRHGCYRLVMESGSAYMLRPREAEKLIDALTHSYKK